MVIRDSRRGISILEDELKAAVENSLMLLKITKHSHKYSMLPILDLYFGET